MLPGLVTFHVQRVSLDLVENMQASVTSIHSPGNFCHTLNVATISFGPWVLASLMLLSAPQYLATWLSTMHRSWGTKKEMLESSFWAPFPGFPGMCTWMSHWVPSLWHSFRVGKMKKWKIPSQLLVNSLFCLVNHQNTRCNWSTSSSCNRLPLHQLLLLLS